MSPSSDGTVTDVFACISYGISILQMVVRFTEITGIEVLGKLIGEGQAQECTRMALAATAPHVLHSPKSFCTLLSTESLDGS